MQYAVTFYGLKADGKRERLGRSTVEGEDARAALPTTHNMLKDAPPAVRGRITEIRIQAMSIGTVAWVTAKPKTVKK